MQIPMLNIVLC